MRSQDDKGGLASWARDLALGARLALGGGRRTGTALVRLALSAIGVGVAVTVLLATTPNTEAVAGVDPLPWLLIGFGSRGSASSPCTGTSPTSSRASRPSERD